MKFQVSSFRFQVRKRKAEGFTLFELVITLTVLAIVIMGTIPLAQNAVKRQRELRLRESLRMMRQAVDEFKRDTLGACTGNPVGDRNPPPDPRTRVVIEDCEIFDTLNIDRYPPTIEQLVDGVKVRQRAVNMQGGQGLGNTKWTAGDGTEEVIKYYLRELPVDPMTGEKDWKFRSSYQSKDDENWDDINVFDVRSASDEEALNGEKYSDW